MKLPRNKKIAMHSFDDADYIIVTDTLPLSSCQQCALSKPTCQTLCMNEGCRYHVHEVIRYGKWRTLYRKIKYFFFNHY